MARIDDYTIIDVRYPEIARVKLGITDGGSFASHTTDDLKEGTKNFYWTQARFNAAFTAAGSVPATRRIDTTAPLTGGGDLSADRTFSIPVATAIANGYLSSTDWSAFNAKESVLTFTPPLTRTVNTVAWTGTTTNVPEGANLYYTQARFDTAFAAKSTTNLAEGTNLYFTNARAIAASLPLNIAGQRAGMYLS